MARVLITGTPGTGKSTVLEILGARGHRTIDTDTDRWSHWVTLPDGSSGWVWREQAIADLLATHHVGNLFVAGCKSNQGKFYPQFDHVVLLSAPADVLLARVAARTTNPYGKRPEERAAILEYLAVVEPQLRATATVEIDTSAPLTRSAFAGFCFPPEVIVLAVRWYLRFGLPYRDLEELLVERGVEVDHVTVYRLGCSGLRRCWPRPPGPAAMALGIAGEWTRPT